MRSSSAVSLPAAAPSTGSVPALASGSMASVVVPGVAAVVVPEVESPPGEAVLSLLPQPETANTAATASPSQAFLRMRGAYSDLVRGRWPDAGDRTRAAPLDGVARPLGRGRRRA